MFYTGLPSYGQKIIVSEYLIAGEKVFISAPNYGLLKGQVMMYETQQAFASLARLAEPTRLSVLTSVVARGLMGSLQERMACRYATSSGSIIQSDERVDGLSGEGPVLALTGTMLSNGHVMRQPLIARA